jgi:hypothetical protein
MSRDLPTSTVIAPANGLWERARRALVFGAASAAVAGMGVVLLVHFAQGGEEPTGSPVAEAANLVPPAHAQPADVRPYAIVIVGDEAQAARVRDDVAQADSLVAATGRVAMSIDVIVVANSAEGEALIQQLLANGGLLASIGREPAIIDLRGAA